jgi:hypothetical protein
MTDLLGNRCLAFPSRIVIPTGGVMAFGPPKEMKIADDLRLCPSSIAAAEVSATLPFVIPSEAEGSAVQRTFRGNVFSTERSGGACGFFSL